MTEIIDDPTKDKQDEFLTIDVESEDESEEQRGSGSSKKKGKRKIRKEELFYLLKETMDQKTQSTLPFFPYMFGVYQTDTDTRLAFIENDERLCTYTKGTKLAQIVASYLNSSLVQAASDCWVWTAQQVKDFVEYWIMNSDPVEKPKDFAFKSDPSRTFARLPWDPEPGETPVWDSLFDRCSNPEILRGFIGSLFVPESDRQQYLWMYGKGNDGKGCILRFLRECFKNAYASEYKMGGNNFWSSGLLNKRVVAYPDCSDGRYVTDDLFKSLTGNDAISMEYKNKDRFTATLEAKFIFGSNDRPRISGQKSDLRRLLYCEFQTWEGQADPAFEAGLWAEGGKLIYKCLQTYRKLAPTHSTLPVDVSALERLTTANEEHFESMATLFTYSPVHVCPRILVFNKVAPRVRQGNPNHFMIEFKKYLERVHGVTEGQVPDEKGGRVWVYKGLYPIGVEDTPITGFVTK